MNNIRIGIIGCGKQAPKHIKGLRQDPLVEVVLADLDPARAELLGAEQGIEWVRTPQELLEDPTIQAVDICTPTPTHSALASQAILSGKDFFCEKPLCATVEEARAIAELLEKTGRVGMVGYLYRFAPIFALVKELFPDTPSTGTSPQLGKVVSAIFRLGGRGGHRNWKHMKESQGGAVNEMLVHMLDLALWYFGDLEDVRTLVSDILSPLRFIEGREVRVNAEDYVVVRAKSQSGVELLLQADLITPAFSQSLEVQGENGTLQASVLPQFSSQLFLNKPAEGYGAGTSSLDSLPSNFFEAQMAEFVNCLRQRRTPVINTVADSLRLMEVMDRIKVTAHGPDDNLHR